MDEETVNISPISLSAILENIINFTNLVDTAEFLLKKYRSFYQYNKEVDDEVGKRRIDIDIDIERIHKGGNKDMLKFVFKNADVLMNPYTVRLHRKGTGKIVRVFTVQKTPEENQKIIRTAILG
jgi:hypothetical protein